MAGETPKKVVDEISKFFLCSSPSAAQERVFIFGNSTHNFVEIIRSSLDFDISCYANSKLFICKAVCYKRLLKFEPATEKVLELKREILESFQRRPRAKSLFNAWDERREQSRTAGIQKVLCYKEKIELLDRVKANFERSYVCLISAVICMSLRSVWHLYNLPCVSVFFLAHFYCKLYF